MGGKKHHHHPTLPKKNNTQNPDQPKSVFCLRNDSECGFIKLIQEQSPVSFSALF